MNKRLTAFAGTLQRIVGHIRLLRQARLHKFPVWIKGEYIYGCFCWMGLPAFERWREHLRGLGIKDGDLAPLRGDGDVIATYRLIRSYQKGYRGSDYAAGDSGEDGDFKLARIDCVPPQKGSEE